MVEGCGVTLTQETGFYFAPDAMGVNRDNDFGSDVWSWIAIDRPICGSEGTEVSRRICYSCAIKLGFKW